MDTRNNECTKQRVCKILDIQTIEYTIDGYTKFKKFKTSYIKNNTSTNS